MVIKHLVMRIKTRTRLPVKVTALGGSAVRCIHECRCDGCRHTLVSLTYCFLMLFFLASLLLFFCGFSLFVYFATKY